MAWHSRPVMIWLQPNLSGFVFSHTSPYVFYNSGHTKTTCNSSKRLSILRIPHTYLCSFFFLGSPLNPFFNCNTLISSYRYNIEITSSWKSSCVSSPRYEIRLRFPFSVLFLLVSSLCLYHVSFHLLVSVCLTVFYLRISFFKIRKCDFSLWVRQFTKALFKTIMS